MEIILTPIEKGGEHSLPHDLNFQSERYEARHNVVSFHGMLNGTARILLNQVPFSLLDLQESKAWTSGRAERIGANLRRREWYEIKTRG
jgi:hypothetical protein